MMSLKTPHQMTKSRVIRYKVEEINCCFDAEMARHPEGEYVRYDNYALLESENARLRRKGKAKSALIKKLANPKTK